MEVNFVRVRLVRKERLCNRKVLRFFYGFKGLKTFRDLRETGPISGNCDSRSHTIFPWLPDPIYLVRTLGAFLWDDPGQDQ